MRPAATILVAIVAIGFASCGGDEGPTVPDVDGQNVNSATLELKSAGYEVLAKGPDYFKDSTVVGQEPAAGSELDEGETVTIILQEP